MDNFIEKLKKSWKQHHPSDGVKSFESEQKEAEAFDPRKRGVQNVPLAQIVGSVGRYHDFDRQFRLKQHLPSQRLTHIRDALKEGKILPPVKLYQIKDEYYVLDGNHRVAAAKELGHDAIAAEIVEFIPSKNTLEDVLYREKIGFQEKTGLKQPLELTEVGQYALLVRQIENHRHYLSQTQEPAPAFETAAADWYQTIYRPLMLLIQKGGLAEGFVNRTQADLYVYISRHQWDQPRERRYGHGIDHLIPDDMEEFRNKMAHCDEIEYPEMKRQITAFVMMNVSAKREFRIIEKLFALDEIREIHSVHGSVDMIAKIILKRDLLTSDAETISYFVHNHIRQIPGVLNTQTLIPGFSKTK